MGSDDSDRDFCSSVAGQVQSGREKGSSLCVEDPPQGRW